MKKIVILILLIGLLLFGIIGLNTEIDEYTDGEEEYMELEQYAAVEIEDGKEIENVSFVEVKEERVLSPKEVKVDFNGLKKINSDCIGWILISDTNINYPIVKGIDNSYYVTHTVKKKENKSGAIFIDMRNSLDFSDRNTIIYGHNLKNSKMFSDLKKYFNKNFFDKHKNIIIYMENKKQIYEVFSVYKTMENSDAYKVNFSSDEKFLEHINKAKESSALKVDNMVSDIDRIITLSTCTNDIEGERIVVIARLIEEIDEEMVTGETK